MVNDMNNMTDDLLVKHLLGETTYEEDSVVALWLEASADNRKQYATMKLIWEQSRMLAKESTIDESAAWKRFQDKVATHNKPKIIDLRPKTNWIRVAAALLFLLGAGWIAYYTLGLGKDQLLAVESGNETRVDTLADGSIITLKKHSKLSYPAHFASNARKVSLDGEAFFEISPDKDKPFTITANGVAIKVVGTSFNVRSSREKTEVVVATGIVEVKKEQEVVTLHPREQAMVLKAGAKPIKKSSDELLYNFYRTKEFVCENTPLWRLVSVLNEAYDVDIIIGDAAIKEKLISAKFQNEPIENVLRVVSETFNIEYSKQGEQYILKSR